MRTLNGPRVHRISPVGKEKVFGGNDLPKSHILSSEWKSGRVREDACSDGEDGEEDDDELPCVICENVHTSTDFFYIAISFKNKQTRATMTYAMTQHKYVCVQNGSQWCLSLFFSP